MKKINNIKQIEKRLINKIKTEMSIKDITNQDISNKLNVNKSTVSMWLSGSNKMSLEIISEIANILEINFVELFKN